MKTVKFHPQAEEEMNIAAKWYEKQQTGLGLRYLNAIHDTINNIQINPKIYPVVHADTRRGLVRVFPYELYSKKKTHQSSSSL